MEIVKLEKKQNTKEMIPQIIERIFTICKTDPDFPIKDKLDTIEYVIEGIDKKIQKKNKLCKQAENLLKDLALKFTILNNANMVLREQILEKLGSEL